MYYVYYYPVPAHKGIIPEFFLHNCFLPLILISFLNIISFSNSNDETLYYIFLMFLLDSYNENITICHQDKYKEKHSNEH